MPTKIIFLKCDASISLSRRIRYSKYSKYQDWFDVKFLKFFEEFYRVEMKKLVKTKIEYLDTTNLRKDKMISLLNKKIKL